MVVPAIAVDISDPDLKTVRLLVLVVLLQGTLSVRTVLEALPVTSPTR